MQTFVLRIKLVQQRMKQEGQDVEGGKERSKMLLAVSKIVFQIVALGLEGVIVLVFHPSPAFRGYCRQIGRGLDMWIRSDVQAKLIAVDE